MATVAGRWAGAKGARRYAEASCPPTWRTSSLPIGPAPPPTAVRWLSWWKRRPCRRRRGISPAHARGEGLACIAEIKRRSPSKGDLDPGLQPELVAKEYPAGGAACLSVLTDEQYFGARRPTWRRLVRPRACPCCARTSPSQEADVADARLMGADAVLLIAAAFDDDELSAAPRWPTSSDWPRWSRCTTGRSSTVPSRPGPALIGVNQRDLRTFKVDHERACALAAHIPADVVAVAESGIRDADDARRLADAGTTPFWWARSSCGRMTGSSQLRALVGPPRRSSMSDDLFVKIGGITSEADALLVGEPRGVGHRVHLRPVAASGLGAPGGRHRQAAARARPDRRRLPGRGAATGRRGGTAWPAWGGAVARARDGRGDASGCGPGSRLVIKAFRAGEPVIGRFEEFGADYLLVDGDNPGSGKVFDWRLAEGVADHHRLIVSGGLRPDNVGPGGGASSSLRRRRLERRRGGARTQGPTLLPRFHRQRAARAHAEAMARDTPRRARARGALRLEGRVSDESLMAQPGSRRPLRRLRRALRPRVADARLPRAREVVRRRLGRSRPSERELDGLLRALRGPSHAGDRVRRLSERLGVRVLLKREDLAHTGSHKLNNVVGQALLTRRMGKPRMIAETGAGQHGVASATAAALFGLECTVFMGEVDTKRQELNVFRMELLGAEVRPVTSGSRTLKDAVNEAMREWVATVDTTHYCLGSVMGPHPFPYMVRAVPTGRRGRGPRAVPSRARRRRPRRRRRVYRWRIQRRGHLRRVRRHGGPARRGGGGGRSRHHERDPWRPARHALAPPPGRGRARSRRPTRSRPASTTRAWVPSTPTWLRSAGPSIRRRTTPRSSTPSVC